MPKDIKLNKFYLLFDSDKEERKYSSFILKETLQQTRIVLIITLIISLWVLVRSFVNDSNSLHNILGIVATAYIVLVLLYSYSKKIKYSILQTNLLFIGLYPLIVIPLLVMHPEDINIYYYVSIIIALLVWSVLLLGLKFSNVLVLCGIFLVSFEIVILYRFVTINPDVILKFNLLIIPAISLSITSSYILDKQKRMSYIMVNDITRKNIQLEELSQELSGDEKNVKMIISQMPVLVFSVNKDFEIEFWNKKCEELFDYTEDEIKGPYGMIKLFPEKNYRNRIKRNFISEKFRIKNFETKITSKNGERKIISWSKIDKLTYSSEKPFWFAGNDITENFETWKALEKSDSELKEAQKLAHIGSWNWNLASNKILLSDEMYRMFGYTFNDANFDIEKAINEIVLPTDLKKLKDTAEKVKQTKKGTSVEYKIVKKNGQERIMNIEGEVILDRNRNVVRIFGTNQDITEIKQAEIFLKKVTKSLEKAQEIAHLGSWEYNYFDGKTYLSKEFYNIFNQKSNTEFAFPDSIRKFVTKDTIDEFNEFYDSAFVKMQNISKEFRIKVEGNVVKTIYANAEIVENNGNIASVYGVFQDVSIVKEALIAVQENEQKFENILKSSPNAIIVVDNNKNITDFNKEAYGMFAYKEEEFISLKFKDLFNNDEFDKLDKLILEQNEIRNKKFSLKRKNNKTFSGEISTGIVKTPENREIMLVVVIKDITQKEEEETRLRNARIRAEESDKLKSAFLANMSHEIRTPMNAIVGFANLLIDTDPNEEEKREYTDYITSNSNSLLTLIDDIIDISKIEAGQIKIKKEPVKLGDLIDNVFASTNEQKKVFQKHSLELKKNVPDELAEKVFILDNVRVKQVLINMINNALKFTEEGSVIFGCKVSEVYSKKMLEFYVKDTGIGIKTKDLHKIFNQFVKIQHDEHTLQRGTGLGLTISKKLVNLMEGAIMVNSEYGKGSGFSFTIPYEEDISEIKKNEKLNLIPETYDWENLNILVAEDEYTNYKYIETILKKTNAKIIRASNGQEAVYYLKNIIPDIILMDIRMPIMDGYEATKLIKKTYPEIPIIAQTAYVMAEEKSKILSVGCDDYISKPISRNKLIKLIAKHIKNS